jgi:flagellar motor switch protein FliM
MTAVAGKVRPLDLTGKDRQVRASLDVMARIATGFTRSARRAMPFLVRQRGSLLAREVSLTGPHEVKSPDGPRFAVRLEVQDGSGWAELVLDTGAITFLLEGVLGASNLDGQVQLTSELTLAQRALVTRVAKSLAQDLAQACADETGLALKLSAVRAIAPGEAPKKSGADGLYVRCDFDAGSVKAAITIGVSASTLEEAAKSQSDDAPGLHEGDPRVRDALTQVDIQLIAELGTVRVNLRDILRLKAGDVLRLNTAIDDPIKIRVGELTKLTGVPVISRGQLAIEIRGRHGL